MAVNTVPPQPPAQVKKLSEKELEKLFDEELAIWEKIKEAKEPAPLEDYLRQHPSGRFSELAQFQLDRILAKYGEKKIEIVPAVANPFSKGTAKADGRFNIGDSYTYSVTDLLTKLERRRLLETITGITNLRIIYNDGEMTTDFLGNYDKDDRGRLLTASQYFIAEYSVGKKWMTRFILTRNERNSKARDDVELDFRVVGKERITVPAGTFDAYKVEGQGFVRSGANWKYVYWIAPDKVRRFLAMEYVNRHRKGTLSAADRYEMVAFKQAN